MYEDKRVLAIIPARGGSKRIPGKNVKILGDKPLIAWTVEAAKKSAYIDRLILSSDDNAIAKVAQEHGCDVPFMRPDSLATDTATSADVVIHALNFLGDGLFDYVILLQPTSPFRSCEDVDGAIKGCLSGGFSSLISTRPVRENPSWMYSQEGEVLSSLSERLGEAASLRWQILNGAIYVFDVRWFLRNRAFMDEKTRLYSMPWERSVDIDTMEDWAWAEFLLDKGILTWR
ncbi:acylneuraminate cytidylyltransferase family protein [Dethiosulfovibrio salsuginis]|uniref:N-acylneuraminate cytidylyltransferase/CMP-N,N'-diacetyllegionaminic acid synthase n=1 Tax=Dethiosulfovibrio salsuginis TaxID=561720 RepID=A0A1X7IPD6_9BACT|nr:acylneuraminate cytidylyltransferase family protein [Dethiosulfovibrio salsuginis]SMG16905.1 N-acylneuraminate cytidylyltransferase/CMP-N,N'-diacetyllegionaminic acid synthase [Dethiosulfovibrio salsuginis]